MSESLVNIVMGSQSDLPIMKKAADLLSEFGISFSMNILSAHRATDELVDHVRTCLSSGIKVFIAGAGGAAHLPGVVAGLSYVPVVGVPIKSSNSMDGWDSVLSILQMPSGVPVATVALDGAKNAGLLAAQILGVSDQQVTEKIKAFKLEQKNKVLQTNEELVNAMRS